MNKSSWIDWLKETYPDKSEFLASYIRSHLITDMTPMSQVAVSGYGLLHRVAEMVGNPQKTLFCHMAYDLSFESGYSRDIVLLNICEYFEESPPESAFFIDYCKARNLVLQNQPNDLYKILPVMVIYKSITEGEIARINTI